jgi:hypothetical protein
MSISNLVDISHSFPTSSLIHGQSSKVSFPFFFRAIEEQYYGNDRVLIIRG